jgi:hypothetical protein
MPRYTVHLFNRIDGVQLTFCLVFPVFHLLCPIPLRFPTLSHLLIPSNSPSNKVETINTKVVSLVLIYNPSKQKANPHPCSISTYCLFISLRLHVYSSPSITNACFRVAQLRAQMSSRVAE